MHTTTHPPIPTPHGGGARGHGYSCSGVTNTELGDRVEAALVAQLGWSNLHPGSRWGRLDVTFTLNGVAVGAEVKAVSVRAAEFKAKMKAGERLEKEQAAAQAGLAPATVIVVVMDDGLAQVWAANGITSARLTPGSDTAWFYQGTVQL